MRRILLILLAAILAVCAAWAVASLPGRVSAEFGPVAIDAPSAVAIARIGDEPFDTGAVRIVPAPMMAGG